MITLRSSLHDSDRLYDEISESDFLAEYEKAQIQITDAFQQAFPSPVRLDLVQAADPKTVALLDALTTINECDYSDVVKIKSVAYRALTTFFSVPPVQHSDLARGIKELRQFRKDWESKNVHLEMPQND
jgi:hypothetical protein